MAESENQRETETCESTDEFFQQVTPTKERVLTNEEAEKLQADTNLVPDFKRNKFELEAQKNWDLFYKRNTTKFFKDRHWTKREFLELSEHRPLAQAENKHVIFEVGCGVGNFMFPLLEDDPELIFYACDFSPRAVEFVKNHSSFDPTRCTAFQCDIIKDDITENVPKESVDTATLIFVLSALHPDKMVAAVKNIVQTLKSGGVLLIRDYGLYDHAMLRFAKGHKLGENFYVRQDGTRAYYFSLEKLSSVMEAAGLTSEKCTYIQRSTVNKKEGLFVKRIFVQGKFVKKVSHAVKSFCEDNAIVDSTASKESEARIISPDEHHRESDNYINSSFNNMQIQKNDIR